MTLLGIDIDNLSRDEIHTRVDAFLNEENFHRIATVNPEFFVEADRNPTFHESLRSADLRVADGFGIVLAGAIKGKTLHRYPGVDLMEYLLAKAERDGLGIFLAIRKDGLSSYEEIRTALLKKYPRLHVGGSEIDGRITNHESRITSGNAEDDLFAIRHSPFAILLCNFGAPEQELFLDSLKNDSESIRLVMGIGGAFDYLTGKKKRAPKWMRAIGLEWLWRLLLQPKRFARIWNATVVFLWKVVFR